MNPEQWLSLKWNGGSTMSDRWLNQSKIIQHRVEKIVNKLELNPEHRAHDGRIQFATMAKDAKVNEYALKRIIGHKIDDLTEKTYTKRKREWLMEEILKIK